MQSELLLLYANCTLRLERPSPLSELVSCFQGENVTCSLLFDEVSVEDEG